MKFKVLKRLIPILLVIGLALAITGLVTAQSGSNVGYVDMQRLQQELSAFQDFQELLQQKNEEFNSYGNYLQTQQKNEFAALEKEKAAAIKGKSEAERQEIEAKYQEKALAIAKEYQRKLEAENTRLSGEVQAKHEEIMAEIESILEEIAKKGGYAVILEKSMVYYGGEDLTEQVIAAYSKNNK
ncbi:MAG TPA: OmpH family outer membrane protein [Firmicutes bacterium]|jgi:outer membrane protein|nr:OmpH family outer membrane protein [Bacillota bacterium]